MKFYASVRIEVRRGEQLKNGAEIIGNRTKCKVVKNKVAPPFKECEFDIMYGEGIAFEGELLDLGAELNVVQKGGAWYSYNDMKLGQGRDNAKNFLKENPDIAKEIEDKIRAGANDIVLVSKKSKKAAAVKEAAKAADAAIDADDDFEEFAPVDE